MSSAREHSKGVAGYADRPIVKEPVWTWEVPVYFFVGGISGMAMVVAAMAWLTSSRGASPADIDSLVATCIWIALFGASVSPLLLISDLGRPKRFLNMVRIPNLRSPMSVGVWILLAFSAAVALLALAQLGQRVPQLEAIAGWIDAARTQLLVAAAVFGALLATYTGVLLSVSAIPAWNQQRRLLPFLFGSAGLGGAVSVLILVGYSEQALIALLWVAVMALFVGEVWKKLAPEAFAGEVLIEAVPATLMMIVPAFGLALGFPRIAAASFLLGSLLSRFGWLHKGKMSARLSGSAHQRGTDD